MSNCCRRCIQCEQQWQQQQQEQPCGGDSWHGGGKSNVSCAGPSCRLAVSLLAREQTYFGSHKPMARQQRACPLLAPPELLPPSLAAAVATFLAGHLTRCHWPGSPHPCSPPGAPTITASRSKEKIIVMLMPPKSDGGSSEPAWPAGGTVSIGGRRRERVGWGLQVPLALPCPALPQPARCR